MGKPKNPLLSIEEDLPFLALPLIFQIWNRSVGSSTFASWYACRLPGIAGPSPSAALDKSLIDLVFHLEK